MNSIERHIQISYHLRVYFTQAAFSPRNPLLRSILWDRPSAQSRRLLIVVDEGLAIAQPQLIASVTHYFQTEPRGLELAGEPLVMEGGERIKNGYFHVSEIHNRIERYGIDRHSFVMGIGGGALLDMVGLAAATAHRGVRLIRLPSTTLSQNDSGIGVKNGINAFGKKNFIGAFAPPYAVINDLDLLASLSERDKRSGYAEAVKVACIRDPQFFGDLERDAPALRRFEPRAMEQLIRRCAGLHLDHIATCGDPFELGTARPLDFGHWSAHKLETLSNFEIRHGEAVATGIALDVLYARRMGRLKSEPALRVVNLLKALGFPLFTPELLREGPDGSRLIFTGLEDFREHLGGQLSVTLLTEIGCAEEAHTIDLDQMELAMEDLRHLDAKPESA